MELPAEWEMFCDSAYFDMWCVRKKGSESFGDGFHVTCEPAAKALIAALLAERLSATERAAKIAEEVMREKGNMGFQQAHGWSGIRDAIAAAIRSQP